jgi:tRNA (guanine-N7-)-methyltransferase
MRGNSPPVRSGQSGTHAKLAVAVRRHLETPWQAPVHEPTRAALAPLLDDIRCLGLPVILDSGCGDGSSTLRLGYRHPDALVIGVDKSEARLQRLAPTGSVRRGNVWLVRAEVAETWRQLVLQGTRLTAHYLLYPNPWPKSTHLHRRWYGHPAFAALLSLGGRLELRSNWAVYVAEFGLALGIAGRSIGISPLPAAPALTPFEQKYRDSGHELWRLTSHLDGQDVVGSDGGRSPRS